MHKIRLPGDNYEQISHMQTDGLTNTPSTFAVILNPMEEPLKLAWVTTLYMAAAALTQQLAINVKVFITLTLSNFRVTATADFSKLVSLTVDYVKLDVRSM